MQQRSHGEGGRNPGGQHLQHHHGVDQDVAFAQDAEEVGALPVGGICQPRLGGAGPGVVLEVGPVKRM